MAHSCRWRFPARPGTGRRLGARHRVAAVLRDEGAEGRTSPGSPGNANVGCGVVVAPGGPGSCLGVGPGFDAALQVSVAIGSNLRRFRDVSGGSSGEEDLFLGFGSDEEVKTRSPSKLSTEKISPRKPRGRPRSSLLRNVEVTSMSKETLSSSASKQELRPVDKARKLECKPEEKRRGRPPANGSVKFKMAQEKNDSHEPTKAPQEEKSKRRKPSTTFQHAAKYKKLRAVKLSPLKSKFKSNKLHLGRKSGVPVGRRRGRPPSSERFKEVVSEVPVRPIQTEKIQRGRKEGSPQPSKEESKVSVRQSPRRMKPVRIIPSSKRTDTTIAKQLLQKAKKGAQKKMELEAAKLQGRKGGTQLKNIRQFIMPVVSTVSSRIIKTPRRFIEDEDYEPPIKIARLEAAPSSGRFSAASCGSSEKSSAASQRSSQATSDDSRSSTPSVDTSSESHASEETLAISENQGRVAETPVPSLQVTPESNGCGTRSRRFPVCNRPFSSRPGKKLLSQPSLQPSASPPPPLLGPPAPLQASANLSDHTSWLIPPAIPMATSFLSASRMHEKRRSILREPTFRWTSLKHSRLESQYFSSAKYAKEGLIRKPIFDNFRSPPLTPEDVGMASAPGFSSSGVVGPGRLFSQLHASGALFDVHKRSPLLRAPRFTPSEAHSRIFESVTLPSSACRSGGASSIRRKRRVFSPIRGSEPRSPSHSMRTRSRRVSSSNLPSFASPSSTSLSSINVSPLSTSALNPSFSLSSTSVSTAPGDSSEKIQKTRKQASTSGEPFSTSSNNSTALFNWFPSSPQGERGKTKGRGAEVVPKDKDVEKNKAKELEKENSRDTRKDKRKKGLDAACKTNKESNAEVITTTTTTPGKIIGKKKPAATEPSSDTTQPAVLEDSASAKTKVSRKGRSASEKLDLESNAKPQPTEAPTPQNDQAASVVKTSTTTISSMLAQADKFPVSDKHVASLLRKAKDQLCRIEKTKLLKQADQPKAQVHTTKEGGEECSPGAEMSQESDSSETSVRGPRIKHVCRRAAVALGRNRAVFPDDMPTLSALPWEEREKVLSSMGNDDKSSVAGSEDADPPAPPLKPIKQVMRTRTPQEPPLKKGRRSRRCGQCSGCQVPEDCGICTNCLDKPKFGGRNIKKQCCKMRKCQNLQWMPSKAYLQKQAKAAKRKERKARMADKKEAPAVKLPLEPSTKNTVTSTPTATSPVVQEESASPQPSPAAPAAAAPPLPPPAPPSKKSEPPKKPEEEKVEEENQQNPPCEAKQSPGSRKATKVIQQPSTVSSQPPPAISPPPAKKESPKIAPCETRKKQSLATPEIHSENKLKKPPTRLVPPSKPKPKEKDKPVPTNKTESTFNLLNSINNGGSSRQKPVADGVHRVRVEFKGDCEVGNVWEMGGLSILTTVPITPRVVCFLCASSGHVDFVYCQVCCEPFHRFCLEERERPSDDQLENWCCRHCKFCHVCGRQQQTTKQLLECNKCRNSYHPECLGPNYPTKPTKKKRVWICTKCVRCKSCGSTTPGKGWDAQWSHDFSLCHDCAKLFAKGNFCPLCNKCYDDDDYESKMMQCGKCDRWVHSKCESLTDEMYEILSNLPESVAYTCINCTEQHPAEWRLALTNELQASLKYVLTALLNSRTSSHLLRYRQTAKPPDLNPESEENMPSRSSPEGPDPPILTQVGKHDEQPPPDLEGVKKKMDQGRYTSVLELSDDIVRIIQAAMNADGGQPELKKANSMVKSFFTRQMERVFPWFNVKKSRFWEPNKVTNNSSMLPNAVLPPSLDHNYAQWQERESRLAEQPPLMKKIIPAPKPKSPGDPESPRPVPTPIPPATPMDHSREESPEQPPPPGVEDNRQCALCLKYGDDNANDAGRLLYIGQDEWTHVNCALWSAEVFEDDDGSLKNVHMAVIRGKQLRCENCLKLGATVGCCLNSCTSNYHFMCSRIKNCVFLEDKKVYCQKHKDLIKGEVVSENGFEVQRRVFVDFEGMSLRRKFLNGLEPENIHMMIGSMTVDCLGILTDLSDCEEKLFPIGYQCSRVYWSTTDARKRCVYTCKILECRPPPPEPDINSTVEHEENRTIAHSPKPLTADLHASSPRISTRPSVGVKVRAPRFSANQRSPGSRPLPSAGSPAPITHEIVTVGDPVLSSGLRSIGSRRHSSSSVSPQQQKPHLPSPPQTEISKRNFSPIGTAVNASDRGTNNAESTQLGSSAKNSFSSNNGLETLSKIPTNKTDKTRPLAPKISDPSSHHNSSKTPSQSHGISITDSTPTLMKLKTCLVPHQKATRRDKEQHTAHSMTDRSKSLDTGKDPHVSISSHGNPVTKDRRIKSKKPLLENTKEKHSNKSICDVEQPSNDGMKQTSTNGNHIKSDTDNFRSLVHNKLADKKLAVGGSSQYDAASSSNRKATHTKVVKDGTVETKVEMAASPRPNTELTDTVKNQDVKGPCDITAIHTIPNTDSEPQAGNSYPSQESSLLLQDSSKAQEDSSYKRRYPRRSARARSNMFFGLTPLYGVRSYGEEDLPFCSSTPGKKRGKRAAEGQVDGADDLSSSGDEDMYYYNFSRTVVSSSGHERMGLHTLFKEEEQQDIHKIPQLDGVDDGTESDTSVTITTGKPGHTSKRNSKQNGADKLEASDGGVEKAQTAKAHKVTDSKMDNCHPVKQDSLETPLSLDIPRRGHTAAEKNLLDTFNSELLKSDSDNNNSDDCGNILPIDIMDFVLKNTPSMQALGESPESSSSELLTLGDGLGLDSNRSKDMGLFAEFSPQLPTSEPVDGSVTSAMSAEEQFELPLELPSDLSVLTTRSPSLPNRNHTRLGGISEPQMSSPSERSLLSLPSADTMEKRVTVTEKSVVSDDGDPSLLVQTVERTPEGHISPDRFISGRIDQEHLARSPCGQPEHSGNPDISQNSGNPSIQVPPSPTVPLQTQKYMPSSSESPGPSQIQNTAVQSTTPQIKTTEKLVVVNQNMQPLYVLQTLPNGVTQLTQSVPQVTSRIEGDVSVLGSMGAGLTLAATLNPTLTSSFSPAGKGILPISHHSRLQTFPAGSQATFLPSLTSQPSGLLIGVQPSPEPQILISDAGQRQELSSSSKNATSGPEKKRQISRLQNRKNKKLAPSVSPASRRPPEVVSNISLINFAAPQLTEALPNHQNFIDIHTLRNPTPHRSIPNIIKRSKSGVMYFDQTPLLPQGVGGTSSMGAASSVIGLDARHLTGQVQGLTAGSPVLNVVSMQTSSAVSPVTGHVTLSSPSILGASELGSIGNLLIKTSPQGLSIQDNHMAISTGSGLFNQSPSKATMATTSSICMVPANQPVAVNLAQPVTDPECTFPISHHRLISSRPQILPDLASGSDLRSASMQLPPDRNGKLARPSSSSVGLQRSSAQAAQKTKKVKRQSSSEKTSRKKHKNSHTTQVVPASLEKESVDKATVSASSGNHKPKTDGMELKSSPTKILTEPEVPASRPLPVSPDSQPPVNEPSRQEPKQDDSKQLGDEDVGFSSPLMQLLRQEQNRQDSLREQKQKTGLLFEISSDDGFQISASSIDEAWKSLTDKVQEARSNARLKQLSFSGVNGLRMLGIIHDAIIFLVEQLYGANRCRNYKFRFHQPTGEEEPPLNPHGSARAEVYLRKSTFDMFNFLASKHRQPPEYKPNDEEEEEVQLKSARRATSMDLPMPMRFRHLKRTSKEAVGVYRSPIHGRGLFCKRNIDAGEMVIEYSGNVIRSTLTDKREKYYDGKSIGCYMFRIDDSEVVDATMHGNAARFINHSCEPNCYSRVIPIDGQKHIVIFAMRKIYRGEELTYDYKFPIEDASNKLACNCGTKKCRKFLN